MRPARSRASGGRVFLPAARWSCARSTRPIRRSKRRAVDRSDVLAYLGVVRARRARRRRHHGGDSGRARTCVFHPVARAVGGPAVREAATVGGNLFAPSPYGDFAAALLALDATVMFAGGFGQREVPLEEFLARPRSGRHAGGERRVQKAAGQTFRFTKSPAFIPRAFRCFSLPQKLPLASGRVDGARIAYNAMDKTPVEEEGCGTRARRPRAQFRRPRARTCGRRRRHAVVCVGVRGVGGVSAGGDCGMSRYAGPD